MDTTVKMKPKTIAEMLPGLECLLSPSTIKDIKSTVKKNPRSTLANGSRTSERLMPMTIAQMISHFPAFESKSPRKNVQMSASSKKKWNTSTKMVQATTSHTSNEQMKHHSVRKVLNFQPSKPKVVTSFSNSRSTMFNAETPKFPKPEVRAKKPLYQLARNHVRISGISNIPETPVELTKKVKSRMTIANKENVRNPPVKLATTPKPTLRKKIIASMIPDTPISNESGKSSGDDSFLQNERDIDYIENQVKPLTDKKVLENITEVSPLVSTPFTEYRNVGDSFTNTDNQTENTYHDNTIMSLDNTVCKDNSKREESVIVSLCEMLNKAKVTSYEQSTELEDLLETQKQIESSSEILETVIRSLMMMKEAQLESLAHIKKLIHNKTEREKVSLIINNMPNKSTPKNENKVSTMTSSSYSVKNDNSKQPTYKIPKKTPCSKKKVIYENQSTSNLQRPMLSQKPLGDRALNMYLQMKERNNYLTTPLVQRHSSVVPNTPALTSINLQQQLGRLFEES